MSKNSRTSPLVSSMIFLSLFFTGCATVRIPIKIDPSFSSRHIKTVVIMPVIDRRVDKKIVINLEIDVRFRAKETLEKKGYRVLIADKLSDDTKITVQTVADMSVEDLALLGDPSDGNHLLFLYVDETTEDYFLGYRFGMKATGSLIDKREKIELWRDKGEGYQGQAGLIGLMWADLCKSRAIQYSVQSLFISVPDASS